MPKNSNELKILRLKLKTAAPPVEVYLMVCTSVISVDIRYHKPLGLGLIGKDDPYLLNAIIRLSGGDGSVL